MIIKLIAPGILPGDHVTVDYMAGVPQRGDQVLIETKRADGDYDEQLLTVKSVTWPVEVMPSIRNHAVASLVEVLCDRAEDVGDDDPAPSHHCKFCHLPIYTNNGGATWWHEHSGMQCCFDVYKPEIATPATTERN